jgi:hypothetical protein
LINIKLSLWKTWKPKNHNNVFWNVMSWVEVESWPLWYLNRCLVYNRMKTKQFFKNTNLEILRNYMKNLLNRLYW